MSNNNIKILHEFSININKEVDEITSKEENGQTITITQKVVKPVPVYFAFKKISRVEREDADIEKASWWNEYVKKGLMPEAILLKTYNNVGGTLTEEQKKYYIDLKIKLKQTIREEIVLKSLKEQDKQKVEAVEREIIILRDEILSFEEQQSPFFENTAEAKSRLKVVNFLVLNLSYYRDSEDKPWIPFFKGSTLKEKLADYELKEDSDDELFRLSKIYLEFLGAFVFGSNYAATSYDIDNYFKEQNVYV